LTKWTHGEAITAGVEPGSDDSRVGEAQGIRAEHSPNLRRRFLHCNGRQRAPGDGTAPGASGWREVRLLLPSLLLVAACAGEGRQASGDGVVASAPDAGNGATRSATLPSAPPPPEAPPRAGLQGFAPPRMPPDPLLSRMLAAIAPYQAHQQPCIARNPLGPGFSAQQRRRSKVIWSDSIELQNRVRAAHGSRILNMAPDVTAGGANALGGDGARFVVKVTGHTPLPAYRLGGRVRDVPVVAEYGMPYSAEQLQHKVNAAYPEIMRLLPDAQGMAVSNGYGLGALFIHVYSPSGQPPANLTSLCEQLVEAAGMPVLLTYVTGRVSVGQATGLAKADARQAG
jgi:hypothetical protein